MAPARTRSVNQVTALAFGVTYALVGLVGFLVSDEFVGQEGDLLLAFQVNHLHNLVHLAIGVALVAASKTLTAARSANLGVGLAYVALAAVGPFITGTEANVIALNAPDHGLHLVSGLLLAGIAAFADKRAHSHA